MAIGGKNFSKLAYLGKGTSRSNIKFYSCSLNDKNDHLSTYDIPGVDVGNVMDLIYITSSPNSTKILLTYTMFNNSRQMIHFFRVKAFNQIEVYGQIEVLELGILRISQIKYNKATNRLIVL